jgi:hypothetical protein
MDAGVDGEVIGKAQPWCEQRRLFASDMVTSGLF